MAVSCQLVKAPLETPLTRLSKLKLDSTRLGSIQLFCLLVPIAQHAIDIKLLFITPSRRLIRLALVWLVLLNVLELKVCCVRFG